MARLSNAVKAYQQNPAVAAASKAKPVVKKPVQPAKPPTVNGLNPIVAQGAAGWDAWQKGVAAQNAVGGFPGPGQYLPSGLGSAPVAAPLTPPAATPLPWDLAYETTVGGINRNRDSTLAGLANEETQTKQAYGFEDVNDPFNRLNMLREMFANRKRGDTNSAAAAGQIYSGAYLNAQAATQHGYDSDYDTLHRNYDSALNSIAARRSNTTSGAEDATSAADLTRTLAALQNRPDPASVPVAAAPVSVPAAPKPAPKPKPKATTLVAAPGAKGVTTTKKGKTVTYTNAVKRP